MVYIFSQKGVFFSGFGPIFVSRYTLGRFGRDGYTYRPSHIYVSAATKGRREGKKERLRREGR